MQTLHRQKLWKPQAMAVNRNNKITPGHLALALPMVEKMPAPIMAAMPNAVRVTHTSV